MNNKNRFWYDKNFIFQMAERKTIMIVEDIVKKIRGKQVKKIRDTASSVSFSSISNEMLREYIKV